MTIQHRLSATSTSSTSPRAPSTTGIISGDTVILALVTVNSVPSANVTPPSGFSLIAGASIQGTPSIHLFQKVAGGAEPGTYSISWTGGGSGVATWGAMYSDIGGTVNVDIVGTQSNVSSTNRDWPSVTTTRVADMLQCWGGLSADQSSTPDSRMTERQDPSGSARVYLMTQTLPAKGATGTRTSTGTAVASNTISITFYENPASGGWGQVGATLDDVTSTVTADLWQGAQLRAYVDNSSANSVNHVATKPTGTVQGDLMLVSLYDPANVDPVAIPVGWAKLVEDTSNNYIFRTYYKYCGPSEPTTWTWTWATNQIRASVSVSVYIPTGGNVIVNATANQYNSVSSTDRVAPAITTTVDDAALFYFMASNTSSYTPPANIIELVDAGLTLHNYAAYWHKSVAGLVASQTFTTVSSSQSKGIVVAVVEQPGRIGWVGSTLDAATLAGTATVYDNDVALRGMNTVSSSSAANTTYEMPQDIAGLVDGDFMLMALFGNSAPSTPPLPPAGWTLVDSELSGTTYSAQIYSKVASGEPASYTISQGTGSKVYGGKIFAFYSLTGKSLQINAHAALNNTSGSTNRNHPSVTVTQAPAQILCVHTSSLNQTENPATNFIERMENNLSSGITAYGMTGNKFETGATGTIVSTGLSAVTGKAITVAVTAASGVTATLTSTLGNATLAATGAITNHGSLTKTLADATLSATSEVGRIGSLAKTLDAATLAATAALRIAATLTSTLDAATLVGTSNLVTGVFIKSVDFQGENYSLALPTIHRPPGVAAHDLMLMQWSEYDPAPTPTFDTFDATLELDGWHVEYVNSVQHIQTTILSRIVRADEPATYVPVSLFSTGFKNRAITIVVLDADAGYQPAVGAKFGGFMESFGGDATRVWPSMTTTTDDNLILYFGQTQDDVRSVPDQDGLSEIYDVCESLVAQYLMVGRQEDAGATGTVSATGIVSWYTTLSISTHEVVIPIEATLSATLDDATLASNAQRITHSGLNQTLEDATLVSVGHLITHGALSKTLANATLAAVGLLPPSEPVLRGYALTASQARLVWTYSGQVIAGFSIERSTNGVTGWSEIATPGPSERSYVDAGRSANTHYYYRIRAYRAT